MSTPRYGWWPYAKNMVRAYPGLQEEWRNIHEQSITSACSGMPHNGGASRTVETIAARQMPKGRQKEFDAVSRAIELTKLMDNGAERMELIRLVHWKKSHTIAGAARSLHCSEETAKRWHGSFIRLVGKCYGFEE